MTVVHIVLFKLKASLDTDAVKKVGFGNYKLLQCLRVSSSATT